jgi:hypothetical protein
MLIANFQPQVTGNSGEYSQRCRTCSPVDIPHLTARFEETELPYYHSAIKNRSYLPPTLMDVEVKNTYQFCN